MKKKIVLWASDENEKKVLIALELLAKENKVKMLSFPEEVATEELYNQLMNEWREDKEVVLPEGHTVLDRPLSITDDLLPENLKVQRSDVIIRAKTEWHFVVLSTKLYDLYSSELEELKEKAEKLTEYDSSLFEEMKAFWSKLSDQARERNLFRDHADKLKDSANEVFKSLKELRHRANEEFGKISKANAQAFTEKIKVIEEKIEKGLGLKPIFDELKKLQEEFKDQKLTKGDRSSIWKKIDEAFKKYKEKRYGERPSESSNTSRLERRYQGLLSAIDKMEKSIARDVKDINFQNKRVGETQGQLEMQLRQAKVLMVQERINSKNEKLDEMMRTKTELETKLENEKAKQIKLEEKKKIKEKEAEIKIKVAEEISQKVEEQSDEAKKLEEAAKAINESPAKKAKAKKESLLSKMKTEAEEIIEDVTDTVKAIAHVAEEKIDESTENIKSDIKEAKEKYHIDEKLDKLKKKGKEIIDKVENAAEDLADKVLGEEE